MLIRLMYAVYQVYSNFEGGAKEQRGEGGRGNSRMYVLSASLRLNICTFLP